MKKRVLILFCTPFVLLTAYAKGKTMDVFILMGQSNMDGVTWTVHLDDPPQFLLEKTPEVLFSCQSFGKKSDWILDEWSPLQTMDGRFGPEISFGVSLREALPEERSIAVMKSSQGGTNLYDDWKPQADSGKMLYSKSISFIKEQLSKLVNMGYKPCLKAVFWFQGEGDSNKTEMIAESYKRNLESFIASIRSDLGEEQLPFILTRVYANRPGQHLFRDQVRSAIENVANEDTHVQWVDVDDFVFPDDIHLDAASQVKLGYRFTKVYLDTFE